MIKTHDLSRNVRPRYKSIRDEIEGAPIWEYHGEVERIELCGAIVAVGGEEACSDVTLIRSTDAHGQGSIRLAIATPPKAFLAAVRETCAGAGAWPADSGIVVRDGAWSIQIDPLAGTLQAAGTDEPAFVAVFYEQTPSLDVARFWPPALSPATP